MMRTTARVARKPRACSTSSWAACEPIKPGDTYLVHVASPDDPDLGNEGWMHMFECAPCAVLGGRGDLIEARNSR